MAHRRGKMGKRMPAPAAGRVFPPPHLTGSRSRPGGWSPPPGAAQVGQAINRDLQLSMLAGSTWNASTAHGTQQNTHRSGSLRSPQTFVRLIGQGAANSPENIDATATRIRLSRRSLSRNRGRAPGV